MAQQPQLDAGGVIPATYRKLYASAAFQATEPAPAHLLTSYCFVEVAGGGEHPTPAALREQTYALSERRPMTFQCLVRTQGMGVVVHILHRMTRYFELPGGGGGGAVDYSLGLLGDVRSAQIPVVEVDNTVFSLIGGAGVRVPTTAVMPNYLQAAPPGTHLGPFWADAPNTEVVRPRVTQVVPAKYAAALVHRDNISPTVA